jgi:hypothetical protein
MLAEVMKCGGYGDPSRFAARGLGESFSVPPVGTPEVRPAPPAACLQAPAVTGLK